MVEKEKNGNLWMKLYLVVLFFCGVALWFTMCQSPQIKMQDIDVELDNKIVSILTANGIEQNAIVKQYAKERNSTTEKWTEFFKTIKIMPDNKPHIFESVFRSIARSMKLGLTATENDDGSTTYKFHSPSKTYSNITLIKVKKI
jgi:hypothetical protein